VHPDLITVKRRIDSLAALCLIFLAACALAGCTKTAPGAGAGPEADAKVFLSAPPEIKAAWDDALATLQTNDQAGAYLALRRLRLESGVTPDQIAAIDAQCKSIKLHLGEAIQKGDTNAVRAMMEIHNASRARGR
jgi:hypothetical protein